MKLEQHPSDLEQELMRNTCDVRKLVQDFPLCSTFKEIDELNQEVRKSMDLMRANIDSLENKAREEGSEEERLALIQKVEEHRGQLAAAQRQFRQASVLQTTVLRFNCLKGGSREK